MDDTNLEVRAKDVDAEGRSRYGNDWTAIVAAVQRARVSQEVIHTALVDPNAVSVFANAGKEFLLREMQAGDAAAEIAYNGVRAVERQRHARLKGRSVE